MRVRLLRDLSLAVCLGVEHRTRNRYLFLRSGVGRLGSGRVLFGVVGGLWSWWGDLSGEWRWRRRGGCGRLLRCGLGVVSGERGGT